MKTVLPRWESWILVLLIIATCLSWESAYGINNPSSVRLLTTFTLIVAFLKTRLILLDFMHLKAAPLPARVFVEVWGIAVCSALLVIYWAGHFPESNT
ncbi:MAG: cytochrome C oxidase subunit IV family protein [Parvibaculaceae bacterium]